MEVSHLNVEYIALIMVFPTLVHSVLKDERCWGKSKCYTVKAGYSEIDEFNNINNKDGKWKKILSKDVLAKINVFFWILGHGKTLTAD